MTWVKWQQRRGLCYNIGKHFRVKFVTVFLGLVQGSVLEPDEVFFGRHAKLS
jgi:hypothetical protein